MQPQQINNISCIVMFIFSENQAKRRQLNSYYANYTDIKIHYDMLNDTIRTKAYQKAIMDNQQLFKDKIVMDVGAGTLILSLLAIKAGAKRVHAVENANINMFANQIIQLNNCKDKIFMYNQQIQSIEQLKESDTEVDIIISEWMGYFLYCQCMIQSIIQARTKWLKQEGLMFPDRARVKIALCQNQNVVKKVKFWQNVYGFNMSPIIRFAQKKILIEQVPTKAIVSNQCLIADINLNQIHFENQQNYIDQKIQFEVKQQCQIDSIVGWFEVTFPKSEVCLNTGPFSPITHWYQTIFPLKYWIQKKKGEKLSISIKIIRDKRPSRNLKIQISQDENKYDYDL